jgi:hypothetical protein
MTGNSTIKIEMCSGERGGEAHRPAAWLLLTDDVLLLSLGVVHPRISWRHRENSVKPTCNSKQKILEAGGAYDFKGQMSVPRTCLSSPLMTMIVPPSMLGSVIFTASDCTEGNIIKILTKWVLWDFFSGSNGHPGFSQHPPLKLSETGSEWQGLQNPSFQ